MRSALRAGVAKSLLLVSLACASCGGGSDAGSASGGDGGATSEADSGDGGGGRSPSHAGADSAGDSGAAPIADTPAGLWYGGVSLCAFMPDQLQASADGKPHIVPIESLTSV